MLTFIVFWVAAALISTFIHLAWIDTRYPEIIREVDTSMTRTISVFFVFSLFAWPGVLALVTLSEILRAAK